MSDVAIIDEAAFIPSHDLLFLAAAPNHQAIQSETFHIKRGGTRGGEEKHATKKEATYYTTIVKESNRKKQQQAS